jgi:diguanylate cyclase (GGDEF)-like protein/PAS domain S-box-containing protein
MTAVPDSARRERLAEAEERFEQAFDHAPIGMALVDPGGRFMRVNRSLCEIVGYDEGTLVGMSFQEITHPEDVDGDLVQVRQMLAGELRTYQMEKRYIHADGRVVWVMLSVSLVRGIDASPLYFISQIEDITDRKRLEDRLRYLANHDEMTGLLNRHRFDEELGRHVTYAGRYGHRAALLLLDLDNFKEVNDSLGHHAGDQLVKAIASRLQERLRDTDLLGRLGGDEFAIFLPEVDEQGAQRVAADLVEHIAAEPVVLAGMSLWTKASIGVAPFDPDRPMDGQTLLMLADAAMYDAKRAGGHGSALASATPPATRRVGQAP